MESVLLFVLGVVLFVVGLGVSIGLHEAGHLIPAKLFGVKVTQFMIGFGKTLFSRRRGETEYGVKAIPLGGYTAMIGMFPPAKPGGKVRETSTGFFQTLVQDAPIRDSQPVREREGGTGFFTTMVDDARTASSESIGEGEEGRVFYRLPIYKRVIIMLGGPFMNLVVAFVMFAIVLCGIGVQTASTTVGSVSQCLAAADSGTKSCSAGDPASPAAKAGLKPGDELLSFNGTPITSWGQATVLIQAAAGKTSTLVVERDGARTTLTVTPEATTGQVVTSSGKVKTDADGDPVTGTVGMVGITSQPVFRPLPITAVPQAMGQNIASVFGIIVNLPQRMVEIANAAFGPGERDAGSPVGLIGVGRIAGDIASNDAIPLLTRLEYILNVIGSLNIALFAFNMIPLLPLDGGHIAGALWEGIRRFFARLFKRADPGPVDMAKLMPVTFVVVIVLGGMSLLLAYADIVKPVNPFG